MKIVVLGASGKVGEAVVDVLQQETDFEIVGISSRLFRSEETRSIKKLQIDVTNFKHLRKTILDEKPNFIINSVGISDEEFCKKNKKIAWAINAELVSNLVSISKILNSFFITFSCDSVFDFASGPYPEDAKPNPKSYLGKTKLAAENIVQTTLQKYTIIRLPLVYGISLNGKEDFVQRLLHNMQKGNPIQLPTNLFTNPIFAEDVAWGVLKAIEKQYVGFLHFGGRSYFPLYEFGKKLAEVFKLPKELVQQSQLPKKEKRGLDKIFTEALLGIEFSTNFEGLITLQYLMKEDDSSFDKLLQL